MAARFYRRESLSLQDISLWAILGLAVFLRFWNLDEFSYGPDEVASLKEGQDLASSFRLSNGVLYFLALNLWRVPFGESPFSLRSFSALQDVLTVGLVYLIGTLVFEDRRKALFSAFLYALAPLAVWYGRSVRMYSAWTLAILTAFLGILLLQKRGLTKKGVVCYTVGLSVAFLLHNYTLFFFLGMALALWLASTSKTSKLTKRHWVYLHLPPLFFGALMMVKILSASDNWVRYFERRIYTGNFFSNLLPLLHAFVYDGSQTWFHFERLIPIADLFLVFFLLIVLMILRKEKNSLGARFQVIFLAGIVPGILFFVLPVRVETRFLLPCVPFFILLMTYFFFRTQESHFKAMRFFSMGLLALYLGVSGRQTSYALIVEPTQWKGLCEYLAKASLQNRLVVFFPHMAATSATQCGIEADFATSDIEELQDYLYTLDSERFVLVVQNKDNIDDFFSRFVKGRVVTHRIGNDLSVFTTARKP